MATSGVHPVEVDKPVAEVLVEGELSPFEHEAVYQLLRKHFQLGQPVYSSNPNEDLGTRIHLTFHHAYDQNFFQDIIREDWRELKDFFRQISYRRGSVGAAFSVAFVDKKIWTVFSIENVSGESLGSALDQLGHLTGIVGQMIGADRMVEPLIRIEMLYDKGSDRWRAVRGLGLAGKTEFVFDETLFKWKYP